MFLSLFVTYIQSTIPTIMIIDIKITITLPISLKVIGYECVISDVFIVDNITLTLAALAFDVDILMEETIEEKVREALDNQAEES